MPRTKQIQGTQLGTGTPMTTIGGATTTTRQKRNVRNVRARTGHSVTGTGPTAWSAGHNVSPQIQQGLAAMINGLTTLNVDLAKITPDQLYQYGLTCFANVQ